MPVHATAIGVTVVSALAEGADRLVASLGLGLGARLEVVLPLPVDDYEKDFRDEASRAEFRGLLARAATVDVVEAAWTRDHNYRTAGLTMADRIDVLVALYDGEPARGTGGTAEIVDYARSLLVPVVDLRASRSDSGITLQPSTAALDLTNAPLTPAALKRLDQFNRVALNTAQQAQAAAEMAKDPDNAWLPYYARADLLAVHYQRRHKEAVRLLYTLSALAVAAVGTQLIFFRDHPGLGWVEFAILVVLLGTMVAARRRELLGKWTSARYIAERMRSAMFLSRVGGTPSFALVPTGGGADEWGRVDWAGRAIREVWFRVAPGEFGTGHAASGALTETEWINREWVQPQIDYHTKSLAKYSRLQRAGSVTAIVLFAISVVASFVHSAHIVTESGPRRPSGSRSSCRPSALRSAVTLRSASSAARPCARDTSCVT